MSSRNEILDSEDEGDFSPVKDGTEGLSYSAILDAPDATETCDQPYTNTSSMKSTDPAVFQRIYEDIRAVANANHNFPHPPIGELSPPRLPSQSKATLSHTSVTSPFRKPKYPRNKEIIDLTPTQVATPITEAATGESDPWGVPSSSPPPTMASLSKVARTYGKRKRASQLATSTSDEMPPTQDPYDFLSTVGPSLAKSKKAKRTTQSSLTTRSHDSSPVLLVLQTEEPPSSPRKSRSRDSMGYGSTILETGAALYMTPSALTTSQKQQYQLVNISSEPEPSLPEPLQRSSCATTIPYSTPSQFASSRRREGPVDELQDIPEIERELTPVHPQSSPDVISEETKPRKRRTLPESGKELAGIAKRRRSGAHSSHVEVELSADQDAELDKLQQQEDAHQVQEPNIVDPPNDEVTQPQVQDSPAAPEPKKKRGREKKEPKSSESMVEETQLEAPIEIQEDTPEITTPAPAKKKRGRPRKSAIVPELEPDVSTLEPPAQEDSTLPVSTAKQPGRRGRKKKEAPAPKSVGYIPDDVEEENKPAPALGEVSRNSRHSREEINASDDEGGNDDYENNGELKENSPDKKVEQKPVSSVLAKVEEVVKKDVKPVSSPVAGTKPLYRVGLSKKSRIAPLLKMIRK